MKPQPIVNMAILRRFASLPFRQCAFAILVILNLSAMAAPPDLTAGYTPPANSKTFNLGPTGMSGWFYHDDHKGNSNESRQILVKVVDAGSPSAGILQVGDVILGANGTGGAASAFASDAQMALANAIADAEARNPAELHVRYWRPGMATGQFAQATLTLRHMGAYSATAPYNCPKSAKILKEGLAYVMNPDNGHGAGYRSTGALALLAANDPSDPENPARMARATAEVLQRMPSQSRINSLLNNSLPEGSKDTWVYGMDLLLLSEYYLVTGDTTVVPGIHALAVAAANGQTSMGTWGHRFTPRNVDGMLNGNYDWGYGSVNSAGMYCFLGLMLAKECGIDDPRVNRAIERSQHFFACFAGYGSIPYNEEFALVGNDSKLKSHESNGKSGMAAICFSLAQNRSFEQKYNTQLAVAAAQERYTGHNGPWFNMFWAPLGAAVGGEQAAASHFRRISATLDLARRWDGAFVFNNLYYQGDGSGTPTYRPGDNFYMYVPALLTYALPLRQLTITGKKSNPSHFLSPGEIQEAEFAETYLATGRTTSDLIADLANFSRYVRNKASEELGKRTAEHATLVPQLASIATNPNAGMQRSGACLALGRIGNAASASVLVGLLQDPDRLVQDAVISAFGYCSDAIQLTHVNALLETAVAMARPFDPDQGENILQLPQALLGKLLFESKWPDTTIRGVAVTQSGTLGFRAGVNRPLLVSAVSALAAHPRGQPRQYVAELYSQLTVDEIRAIAPALVDHVKYGSPGLKMFDGGRKGALRVLTTHRFAEAVPLSKIVYGASFKGDSTQTVSSKLQAFDSLIAFGATSTLIRPDPDIVSFCEFVQFTDSLYADKAAAVLNAIANDLNPLPPTPLKSVQVETPPQTTLPNYIKTMKLSANGVDFVKGNSVYTWEKVRGAGQVTFHPNGTAEARNTTLVIDGAPGKYLIKVTMSDSLGLTEVSDTIEITLLQPGGGLPPNTPPTAISPPAPHEVNLAVTHPIVLKATDSENSFLSYAVTSPPTKGKLSGQPPYLTYTSDYGFSGEDSFTFQVTDSEGLTDSATVLINVAPGNGLELFLYEPFDYSPGKLNGASGMSEVGLSGIWTSNTDSNFQNNIVANSPTYGNVTTKGGKFNPLGGNRLGGRRPISSNVLVDSSLLAPGATLYFSALVGMQTGANPANTTLCLALANNGFPNANNQWHIASEGTLKGDGVGFTMRYFLNESAKGRIKATRFRDSSFGGTLDGNVYGTWSDGLDVAPSTHQLIVGRITWSDDVLYASEPGEPEVKNPDVIEIFQPASSLNFPGTPISTLKVDVDQSTYDTLTFCYGDKPLLDEIRFGPTYASVVLGTHPAETDTTPPALAEIVSLTPGVNGTSISLVAATSYDISGVQYRFKNLTLAASGEHDSGWQNGTTFVDTGLTPGQTYTYQVLVRDRSGNGIEVASPTKSVTTRLFAYLPDFSGFDQATAVSILTTYGFTVGTISQQYHPTIPEGMVATQSLVGNQNTPVGAVVNLVLSKGPAPAPAIRYWDGGITDILSNGNGVSAGGTGIWNTALLNWDAGNQAHVDWNNLTYDTAVFAGTGGTVTIGSAVTVGGINFETANYVLSGGTITLGAGANIHANATATISSVLAGDVDLNKTGNGVLTLNAANTYTGVTTVAAGALNFVNSSLNGFGGGSGRNIDVAAGAGVRRDFLNNAFLNRISETNEEIGLMTGTTANALDLSGSTGANLPNAFLGTWSANGGKTEYSGILTPATDAYRLGTKMHGGGLFAMVGNNKLTGSRGLIVGQTGSGGLRVMLAGANDFSGETVIRTGAKLTLANNLALQNSALNIGTAGGNLALNKAGNVIGASSAASPTFGGLIGSRNLLTVFTNSGGNNESNLASTEVTGFTLNVANGKTCTYTGAIANFAPATTLTKTGQGTQVLGGANTYTGATTVSAGTLSLMGGSHASPITVASGASLRFTLGSPVTSSSSLNVSAGTIDITGSATQDSHTLMSATGGITGTPVLASPIPGYSLLVQGNELKLMKRSLLMPVWTSNPVNGVNAAENSNYSATLANHVTDPDGSPLTFAKTSGPAWLNVAANGTLSGTPTFSHVGLNSFIVSVTDGNSAPVSATLNITVVATTTLVPNVVGLSQSSATSSLASANLAVGAVTQQYSGTVPAGSVISQAVAAGSRVVLNSAVNLVVSLGIDPAPKLFRTSLASVSSSAWTTVSLGQNYISPVIVATPVQPSNTSPPVVTRIRNVTSNSFELKLDRVDTSAVAVSMPVRLLVVEEGVYTLATYGVKMEAVKFTSTVTARKSSWVAQPRTFQNSYTNPVVLGQVMSANDPKWSVFWSMGASATLPVSATSLNIGKHVGEDPVTTRADETIGYIVIEAGTGNINGIAYEAGLGSNTVQGPASSATPYTYTLSGQLQSVGAGVLSQSGMLGIDGSWAVFVGATPITPAAIRLYVMEDEVMDSERSHTGERVGYLIFE